MLIILEGLDKTGKSTLAEAIAARIGADIRHRGAPKAHPLIEYEREIETYLPGAGEHVVYDRYHWGETVWPTIYSRRSEYTSEMFVHTELLLRSRGAFMVLATSRAESIVERLEADRDPYPPPNRVKPALSLFADTYRRSVLPSMVYDFERMDMDLVVDEIVRRARLFEEAVLGSPTLHWVGSRAPSLLIVGDQPGPPHDEDDRRRLPFVPWKNTSGSFLFDAAGWSSRSATTAMSLAITNSMDGSEQPLPVAELYSWLGQPQVVALGNAASSRLSSAQIPHGAVPHPQYVRRFHQAERNTYGAAIYWAARYQEDLRKEHRWRTLWP